MFNPKSEKDMGRLRQAAVYSQRQWAHFLENRTLALKQMVGNNYGEKGSGTKREMLYPMLSLYVKTISRLITSDNPACHFNHWNPEAEAFCDDLEIMVNDEFQRIDLGESIAETVMASMFGLGIAKVGRVMEGATEEKGGYLHKSGGLFVDPVLDEDFIFDMRAKRWEGVSFLGDSSRVPYDWAKTNKSFIKSARDRLRPSSRARELPLAGSYREIRSQLLPSFRGHGTQDEYEDMIDLVNLWMPSEGLILVVDSQFTNVLSIKEWEGPPHGPYHILGYTWVPGNLVPVSPVSELLDLHLATNVVMGMVGDGVANMKTVVAVEGVDGDADGKAVVEAPNRGVVKVRDTSKIKPMTFNGPDANLLGLANTLLDRASYFMGGLESIAGLGAQSGTVGQDRLMAESANRQITDMQGEVMKFTTRIMSDLAWYIKTDPDWERQLVKQVSYADMKIPFVGRSADIPGNHEDYKLNVEPYSLKTKTPAERMMMLRQMTIELIVPLMPMLQQQGMSLNMEKLLKKIAEYSDLPELADIIVYNEGEAEPPAGEGQDAPAKPANTTRRYIRENQSTATRKGTNAAQLAEQMQRPRQGAGEAVSIG